MVIVRFILMISTGLYFGVKDYGATIDLRSVGMALSLINMRWLMN